jgi:hypothetical protein
VGAKVKIETISIVTGLPGTDSVALHTDLPLACWPYAASGQVLHLEIPRGKSEAYCAEHFPGVKTVIINATQRAEPQ